MAVNDFKNLKIVLICLILFLLAVLVILIKDSEDRDFGIDLSFTMKNNNCSEGRILFYEPVPNTTITFEGYNVKLNRTTIQTINSGGFRGREYSVEKPEEVYRIVVLGDSFTFGLGLNDNETFSYHLEQLLNEKNISGKRFEVLNFGVSGYNTVQEVAMLKMKALKYLPDMVIIAHQGNDIEDICEIKEMEQKLYEKHLVEHDFINNTFFTESAYFYHKSLELYYSKIGKKSFDEVFQIVQVPMQELYNLSLSQNFSLMIVHFPVGYREREQSEWLSNFSTRNGICYLDLIDAYKTKNLYSEILHPKDTHPNPYANRFFAEYLFDKMMQCKII